MLTRTMPKGASADATRLILIGRRWLEILLLSVSIYALGVLLLPAAMEWKNCRILQYLVSYWPMLATAIGVWGLWSLRSSFIHWFGLRHFLSQPPSWFALFVAATASSVHVFDPTRRLFPLSCGTSFFSGTNANLLTGVAL